MNRRIVQLVCILVTFAIVFSGVGNSIVIGHGSKLSNNLGKQSKLSLSKSDLPIKKVHESCLNHSTPDPEYFHIDNKEVYRDYNSQSNYLPVIQNNFSAPNVMPPKSTDANGEAHFELPELDVVVKISENNGPPVEGMSVVLLYKEDKLLAFAHDPSSRYYPSLAEVPITKNNASLQSTAIEPETILLVVSIVSVAYNVYELYIDPPQMIEWNLFYTDICVTVDQLANAINLNGAIISFVLKLKYIGLLVKGASKLYLKDSLTKLWCSKNWDHPMAIRHYHIPGFPIPYYELKGLCPDREPEEICSYPVSGFVFDEQTSLGLPGARVRVLSSNLEAISGIDGSYSISSVPVGLHTIEASKQGYVSQSYQVNVQYPGSVVNFSLTPESTPPTCYTLTLKHTGQGSDPAGTPSHSTDCPSGKYVAGESIQLSGASPDPGWEIGSWSGTNNNSSISSTNSPTIPSNRQPYRHY